MNLNPLAAEEQFLNPLDRVNGFDIRPGLYEINGATSFGSCVNFTIHSQNAVSCELPAPTITAKDRMALVTVHVEDYKIVDIGLRMLTPRELFDTQGFPPDYIIDVDADGKPYPKSEQVDHCGNAVCPPIPTALVRANLPELCEMKEAG